MLIFVGMDSLTRGGIPEDVFLGTDIGQGLKTDAGWSSGALSPECRGSGSTMELGSTPTRSGGGGTRPSWAGCLSRRTLPGFFLEPPSLYRLSSAIGSFPSYAGASFGGLGIESV